MKLQLAPLGLLCGFLAAPTSHAQSTTQYLWANVYVGMTATQLAALYPNMQTFTAIDGGVILVGPQYRISDGNFTVQFHLKYGLLDGVVLFAGAPAFINELPSATQTYRQIKATLTAQYGAPLFSEDNAAFSSNYIRGDRHVTLTYITIMGKPSMTITYG
jgi:hypothetical protein